MAKINLLLKGGESTFNIVENTFYVCIPGFFMLNWLFIISSNNYKKLDAAGEN